MHAHSIENYRHRHVFLGQAHRRNEARTWTVIAICAAMMVAEIAGGLWFGSVALVADGLHMSTHAGALLIAALAYSFSRWYADDARLTFGTGKVGDLAAFTSAIALAMIACFIGYESASRLLAPQPIAFNQAIPIAALGLAVNLLSAYLLRDDHDGHGHVHPHGHAHPAHSHETDAVGRDHNLRAAFVHVLADAAVSVLVIAGLLLARAFGWLWLDPAVGLVATAVILSWAWTLVRSAGAVLLDACPDPALARNIALRLELNDDRISDLHLWRLGPGHLGAIVALVSDDPKEPSVYKKRLAGLEGLSHVTIEVERCSGAHRERVRGAAR